MNKNDDLLKIGSEKFKFKDLKAKGVKCGLLNV
jgi:hypothetical protein